MSKLIVSYQHMPDWYVGEIHKYFYERLCEKYKNIEFEFVPLENLQQKYSIGTYAGNYPSFFNHYNFIITNPKNDATFINSLNDYAPFCVFPGTGVENFDVKKFGFVSNYLTNNESVVSQISQYNPTPSFYILENFSDIQRVEKYRHAKNKINKVHFLGLLYGKRLVYEQVLERSKLFNFQSKSSNWKSKDDYFEEISKYKMSLSLDGAARICHRDIECIGIGNLLVRETLEIDLFNPLIPNEHYFELISKEEKHQINSSNEESIIFYRKLLEDRIKDFTSNKKLVKKIIKQGINWYDENCLPKKQFKILESLTEKLEILI